MKLECRECNGSGMVTCPCCDGEGARFGRIDSIKLLSDAKHYDELLDLQKDAARVKAQCEELKTLMPQHAEKYEQQLNAVLLIIDHQAEKLDKSP